MKKLSAIIMLLFAFYNANAQWIQTNGIKGSEWITCIVKTPKSILAGTNTGLYRSTDEGLSWKISTAAMRDYDIRSIAAKGDTVFAGASTGLFTSRDNGINWEPGEFTNGTIQYVFINNNRLFVMYGEDLHYSDNFGETFSISGSFVSVEHMYAFNNNLYVATFGDGVFKSTDNGLSWLQSNNGLLSLTASHFTSLGNTLFLSTINYPYGTVYRSTNNGDNWIQTGSPSMSSVNLLSTEGQFIYAAASGLFLSTNNGYNWISRTNGLSNAWIVSILSTENQTYAAPFNSVICKTTNQGMNWIALDSGFCNTSVNTILCAGGYLIAGTGREGICRSSDNGNTWTKSSNGYIWYGQITIIKLINNILYAGIDNSNYECLYASTNLGESWYPVPGFYDRSVRDIIRKDSLLFIGTDNGVFKSTNQGLNWVITGLAANADVNKLLVKGNKLFAACMDGVYISANNGIGWGQTLYKYTNDITILNNDIYAGCWPKVYKSTDNGNNWNVTNSGSIYVNSLCVSGNTLFANANNGVYSTSNGGQNWINISEGLTLQYALSMVIKDDYAYLGTKGAGVYKRPLTEIVSVKNISGTVPAQFNLYQNYPNPFNPVTKIKFDVPENGKLKIEIGYTVLKVYDILGKEVATLVNERLQPGTYETTFDGSNLNSGIYFYRLSINNKQLATRKMALLK